MFPGPRPQWAHQTDRRPNVTYGQHLGVLLIEKPVHIALALRSDPDAAHANAVVGGDCPGSAQRGGGDDDRERRGGQTQHRGLFKEMPASGAGSFHWFNSFG